MDLTVGGLQVTDWWELHPCHIHSLLRLSYYTLIIPLTGLQQWSPLRTWWNWRWKIMEKKHKSMDNEHQSITSGESRHMWQQTELSWSLACLWLMPCLAMCGWGPHNALQTTVWRLNFLQPQSSETLSSSSCSFTCQCLPGGDSNNMTINRVAIVINHESRWSQSSLFYLN